VGVTGRGGKTAQWRCSNVWRISVADS